MKHNDTLRYHLIVLILLMGFVSTQSNAQTVNVTMTINTSTCLDTLHSNNVVLLQGESKHATLPAIKWDTSSINCSNIGGDYWKATLKATQGDTIKYKFVTFFDKAHSTFHWTGYEGPITAAIDGGGNRVLIVGATDTTLALQYFNGWESNLAQYWRPFASKADSIAIYFRVNMGGANFDPATQSVEARGGAPLGTDNPWIKIVTMTRETNSINSASFWSGVAYVAKSAVTSSTVQSFKFVIPSPETWESTSNRSVPVAHDTTMTWVYFNNVAPHGSKVAANVLFRLKLDALEKAGLFNRAFGDKVAVTGAQGWPPGTFTFDTEPTMLKMTYNSTLSEWNLSQPFNLFPNQSFPFKYYISWDSTRVDSTKPHFIRGLALSDGWEEPGSTGGADRNYTYSDQTTQNIPGDFGASQNFFNSLTPKGVLTNPIVLTFKVNMAPATNVATNPTNPLFRPGTDSVFVQFDGSFVPITQGLTEYGVDNRIELKDPDGDGVYTGSVNLKAPTFYQMCYRVTYSNAPGTPFPGITNGGGVQLGRRYYQYVHPSSVSATGVPTFPASYTLATMQWAPSVLTVENPPDLDTPTGVTDKTSDVPDQYQLNQNYPNPFNPSTVVTYTLPASGRVTIDVYNILGQKVASLFNGQQVAGVHSIAWNAENDRGQKLSSGVYLLKMQAGTFSQARKMVLAK